MGGCGRGSRRGADTPGRRRPCVSSTDGWAGATSSTGPPMSSADRSASPPSPVLRLVDGAVGWFAAVAAVDLGLFAALADAPDGLDISSLAARGDAPAERGETICQALVVDRSEARRVGKAGGRSGEARGGAKK